MSGGRRNENGGRAHRSQPLIRPGGRPNRDGPPESFCAAAAHKAGGVARQSTFFSSRSKNLICSKKKCSVGPPPRPYGRRAREVIPAARRGRATPLASWVAAATKAHGGRPASCDSLERGLAPPPGDAQIPRGSSSLITCATGCPQLVAFLHPQFYNVFSGAAG